MEPEKELEIEKISHITEEDKSLDETEIKATSPERVVIKETGTVLDILQWPGVSSVIGEVNPGEIFEVLEAGNNWTKIKISDELQGWISNKYIEKEVK